MIVESVHDFKALNPKGIVCIDYGQKRLGVAVSPNLRLSLPVKTIVESNIDRQITAIENLTKQYNTNFIVIGIPLYMDGTKSKQTITVEAFVKLLDSKLAVNVLMQDERLTSIEADSLLKNTGMKRKRRTKHHDTISAVLILEEFLALCNL